MRFKLLALAVASVALSGCWHITVKSNQAPSPTIVDKPWQMSFVAGLVPPPELNVKDQCPNGVAQVETETSFINGLVSALTFQIITPIHAKVTCASR